MIAMGHAYWFKPKRIGYGAYPTTWEGWVVIAAYSLVLAVCAPLIVTHRGLPSIMIAPISVIVAATVALFVICKKKTDGSWGWNAGARQISGKND
jgi:hypothetical protein